MSTVVINSWSDIGLNVNPNAVNIKMTCPACSETRKNKRDKCLSVSPVNGVANCHNCGECYVIKKERTNQIEYKKPEVKQSALNEKLLDFFKTRGIEERTLEYFKITESTDWMYAGKTAKEGTTLCINFNYFQESELINVKFRASEKRFRMVAGAKLIFYNLDAIKGQEWCAIQEGEIDSMSAYQSGVFKSVSVPNGASSGNQKLEYLDNCIEYFAGMKKIIIATDNDLPGKALADELIRRLGRDRCYSVEYPEGCKDTNEVLLKHGEKAVKKMYDEAKPVPIEGIFDGEDLEDSIIDIYENGYPKGFKIGYREFDDHISWLEGQVTLWTGIPGSGKSELIDQVLTRLSSRHGWRHAIFSPENEPHYQASAIISKFLGGEMVGDKKVSEMKRDKGIQFIKEHFFFMKVDEIDVTLDGILELARELVIKKGINSLLIDPYNYIEHKIPAGFTETMYVSALMSKLVSFAKANKIHINMVAHPTKIQKDKNSGKYNVATLYDISGSAHFYNKTFNGISVYRDYEQKIVTAYIQKVKFKWIGKVGSAEFSYDYSTGRYAPFGEGFENELDHYLQRQAQADIPFTRIEEPETVKHEPGQLTDISKLVTSNSFDFKPRGDAPF